MRLFATQADQLLGARRASRLAIVAMLAAYAAWTMLILGAWPYLVRRRD